ncbi:MAG: hypothetical protein LAT55_12990 [Opitutales bacterium]|nr:hypothetical protein [Opitutales bacterium]
MSTTFKPEAVTDELIASCAMIDDIDAAVLPIQERAGIMDGGVAAMFFSPEDIWEKSDHEARKTALREWLNMEISFHREHAS